MSFFALINLVPAKFLEKVYVTIDLLIIVINLGIRMKHHSDKTSLLKAILLKEINDSLTRNDDIPEVVNENTDTNFYMTCYIITLNI